MKKPVLLVVDDERNTREGLARALRLHYDVRLAESGARALEVLDEEPVDLVLSDIRMPEMDGLTLMRRIRARSPRPEVILLTAYGSIETAVEAMKEGAYDFLTKPVNLDRLELLLKRALSAREMARENRQLRERLNDRHGLDRIVGNSDAIRSVHDMIRQVAPSRATVLIEGESGTGKELVAQALHRLSPRDDGPFIAVHCAALAPSLLESELFGHEKGAFTGAHERRPGRFEMADGGTLFLDEIGEIDASTQVKILRALEERRFERVGGQAPIEVDVRVIAATNKDLRAMVDEGQFREDLYYRLNVITIRIPPLRERREDIPLLAHAFLTEFSAENGKPVDGFTSDALSMLTEYHWPGNVRELRNAVEHMVVLSRGNRLTVRDIPGFVRPAERTAPDARPGVQESANKLSLDAMERRAIEQALEACGGHRIRAAKMLGISRRTLHRRIREFGLADRYPRRTQQESGE